MIAISVFIIFNLSFMLGGEVVKYRVKEGDTLWSIAKKYYKSGEKWMMIFSANKDVIKDPDIIIEGSLIEIPLPDNNRNNEFDEDKSSETIISDTNTISSIYQQTQAVHLESVEFEEVEKGISNDFPLSQSSFDISSKRIRFKKRYIAAKVLDKNKSGFFMKGDKIMLSFNDSYCSKDMKAILIKKVKEDSQFLTGDIVGYCNIEMCDRSVAICKIHNAVREIVEGDSVLIWR
ncbi:MAG: LysM peptidoglycan-binding domain-containing protein [Elusimicrobiales bacterium]